MIKVDPAWLNQQGEHTVGDATKAQELGWEAKTSFDEMVEEMVLSDLDEAKSSDFARSGLFARVMLVSKTYGLKKKYHRYNHDHAEF